MSSFDFDADQLTGIILCEELTSWGQQHHSSIPWGKDVSCIKCNSGDCNFSFFTLASEHFPQWANGLIGYDKKIATRPTKGKPRNFCFGTLIFECPTHHYRFWIHLRGNYLTEYITQCPLWPKQDLEVLQRFGLQ